MASTTSTSISNTNAAEIMPTSALQAPLVTPVILPVPEAKLSEWGARLADPSVPLVSRAHALWGLRHAREPTATRQLAAYVVAANDNALLQHEAAYCLGQRGDPSAVAPLIQALREVEHEPIVRHEAAEALAALAATPGVNVEEVKKVLEEFRHCGIVAVEETCEVGLGRIAWLQSQPAEDEATRLAESAFPNTIDPAPAFPASATPPIPELRSLLLSPSTPLFDRYRALFSLRNAALACSAMGANGPDFNAVVEALSASLAAPGSALLRHEVAFLLGQLSIAQTGDALIERLEDKAEAPMVRHEAAMALGEVAGAAEVEENGDDSTTTDGLAKRAREALLAGCKDPEPVVRDSCALALDMADYVASNERFQFAEVPKA